MFACDRCYRSLMFAIKYFCRCCTVCRSLAFAPELNLADYRDLWTLLARQRCRRLFLSGFRPCRYYYCREECSHRLSPDLARYRAQCVVCVNTSSLLSLVIDGFDTLSHSMRGLCSHVIAVMTYYCPVSSLGATTIAVGSVHTDCHRIGPAIVRDVWSVLARHRYRHLSLTCSTPCRARA